jgi:hypothetical protein
MEQTVIDGQPQSFTIEFVKEDGSLRAMRAQKHVKFPSSKPNEKSKFKYNLKSKGNILLYDLEENAYRSVKIDSILTYNSLEVIH